MENFNYYNPCQIIFGKDSEKQLGELLKTHKVKSLLLIYGGSPCKKLGIYDSVKTQCEEQNIRFTEHAGVVPNPRIELVREIVEIGKADQIDFILAVGGGSVMDTAKAVAMGINYTGDVWNFFTKDIELPAVIPVGAIPTLPASGSETSCATIISDDERKLGYEHNDIIPKFAIMNPEFTLSLPAYQTGCGIADIYSHLLERYFSPSTHTDTTDYLLEGAIKALLLNAERILENPSNLDARSEIQWLSSIAHSGILDTGRVSCWGSHRIEHEISAKYNVTHGEGMAIILVAFTKYMATHKPERLAQLANRVYNYDYHNYSIQALADKIPQEFTRFFKSLGLKTTLSELDINSEHFEEMANKATNNDVSPVGRYMPLNNEKIIEILNLSL